MLPGHGHRYRPAVRHYFVNQFPVTQPVTAAGFERLALGWLNEIFTASDTAIVCGGTGLYIRALCEGLDDMPEVSAAIMEEIDASCKAHGISWLQDALRREDPLFTESAEWSNPARLIRALSFVRATGKSIMAYRSGSKKKQRPFRMIKVALELPREALCARINERVDSMMAAGLQDEVAVLLPYRHLKPLQTVGYAELFDYLDGRCTPDEAVDKIKQHTRNYAKRQITWLRKETDVRWIRGDEAESVMQIIQGR